MKTRRLISSISYNTPDYLEDVLGSLVQNGVIEYWHFICHHAEEDDRKPHIHVAVQPSKAIDTRGLSAFFQEAVNGDSGNVVGTVLWRASRIDDWLQYAVHDEAYLASKGETKKYHYSLDDVRTSCREVLVEQWHSINRSPYRVIQILLDYASKNAPVDAVLASGRISLASAHNVMIMYPAMLREARRRALDEAREARRMEEESARVAQGLLALNVAGGE